MLFTTSQMSTNHYLSSRPLQLAVEGKALERVKSTKLLGVHLKENLKWDVHVKHLASTCYGTLANLMARDWHILKAAHKALYSSDWPLYVSLERSEHTRVLRSNVQVNLVLPLVSNTSQDCSTSLFNSLPADIKPCTDHRAFSRQTFNILKQRCLTI